MLWCSPGHMTEASSCHTTVSMALSNDNSLISLQGNSTKVHLAGTVYMQFDWNLSAKQCNTTATSVPIEAMPCGLKHGDPVYVDFVQFACKTE